MAMQLFARANETIPVYVTDAGKTSPRFSKQVVEEAIKAWSTDCSGYNLPDFELRWEDPSPSSKDPGLLIIDFRPDLEPEIPPGNPAGRSPADHEGNKITLFAKCPRNPEQWGYRCSGGEIDFKGTGGRAALVHEMGHSMGLGHDKCAKPGLMAAESPWSAPFAFLPEYCAMAERITTADVCNALPALGDRNSCDRCHWNISGSISGVVSGEVIQLQLSVTAPGVDGQELIVKSGGGAFNSRELYPEDASYSLEVVAISNPKKICGVSGGEGVIGSGGASGIAVACECFEDASASFGSATAEATSSCDDPVLDDPRENLPPDEISDLCLLVPAYCDGPDFDPWFWQPGPPSDSCPKRQTLCTEGDVKCHKADDGTVICAPTLNCVDVCTGTASLVLEGPRMRLDRPSGEPLWSATVALGGWANDTDGVALLRFYVDGDRIAPPLLTGLHRPDACSGVAGDCDPYGGFLAELDTRTLSDGPHKLQIVAIDSNDWPVAAYHELAFEVDNSCTATDPPQVELTAPATGTVVAGAVAVTADAIAAAGIERMRLVVDGVRSTTDWSAPFAWSWDSTTVGDGQHTLQAEVYDRCGGVTRSPGVAVNVVNHNEPPRLQVEWPQPAATVQGVVEVSGWALDTDGVPRIELRLGEEPVALAQPVQRVLRTDVCSAFGIADPSCPRVGWSAVFDTSQHLDGGYLLTVVATDGRGASTTSSRPLSIANQFPGPPGVSAPQSQTVMLGDTATFSVEAWGEGPFSFQWQVRRDSRWVNLSDGDLGGRVSGARTAVLTLQATEWSDAGGYRCVVSNLGGSRASVSASFSVVDRVDPPNVVAGLDPAVSAGSPAELRITAEGEGPLSFRWQRYTSGWQDVVDGNGITGATTAVLRIDPARLSDAGSYRCRVSNLVGTTTSTTMTLTVTEPVGTCAADAATLCLLQNRFSVRVNVAGADAQVIPWSDLVGFFRLNNPANVEVMVKALDGRASNGHFWIFHGSLTSQPYTLTVTDTVQGVSRSYFKGSGSFCGGADTAAFYDATTGAMRGGTLVPLAPVSAASGSVGTCTSTETSVCLLDNRFHVEVWRDGAPVRALEITDLAGTFSFGRWENSDVVVKVLDGTPVNDWYWVFFGSMTSQGYEVRVTDTANGELRTYPAPATACGQADTTAF